MPSVQDHPAAFTPARPLQSWTHSDKASPFSLPDLRRPSMVQADAPKPLEPVDMQSAPPRPYLPARIDDSKQPRQQLPGLQELLSPAVRPGPPSLFSPNWPSVNSTQPKWPETHPQLPVAHRPSQVASMPFNPTPPPFHRLSLDVSSSDRFTSGLSLGARPPLPAPPPLRRFSEYQGPRAPEHLSQSTQALGIVRTVQPHADSSYPEESTDGDIARRLNSTHAMRNAPPAGNYSLQCVGQRHIPGEGLCYVFKDGSTCPTIIDGEPVNPLWGTTKAGKARKRLAQACL
jgi:hypothetical protein